MLIPLGILASAGGVPPIVSDYELISTTVLGSSAANVTFNVSSFASTYKHLQIRAVAKTNRDGPGELLHYSINGASPGNHDSHHLWANGSSVTSDARLDIGTFARVNDKTANLYAGIVSDFLDAYSTTKNKTVRTLYGFTGSNTPEVGMSSVLYNSTTAISSIQIYCDLTTFLAGSRFSIYGIKG
jgi:hypothetical protein